MREKLPEARGNGVKYHLFQQLGAAHVNLCLRRETACHLIATSWALRRFAWGTAAYIAEIAYGGLGNEVLARKTRAKNGTRPWQPNVRKIYKTPFSIMYAKAKSRSPYFWSTG
jgi:hypothetical protein